MRSSYIENNYGDTIFSVVSAFKPHILVELGVLDGYSTMHIAKAVEDNRCGHLYAYDLFEDYPYKHGIYSEVREKLDEYGYLKFTDLARMDAYEVHNHHADNSVSFLHVDISNTGETLKRIMQQWDSKMVYGGVILFEGGSEERDEIEWMKKYNMPPIKPELESNQIIKDKYVFGTYLKFPSLTCLLKKG